MAKKRTHPMDACITITNKANAELLLEALQKKDLSMLSPMSIDMLILNLQDSLQSDIAV